MENNNSSSLNTCTGKNILNLAYWSCAWVACIGLAAFGPKYLWQPDWITFAVVILSVAIGFGMILADIRHLESLDELMQKIHLEVMALTLGLSLVVGLGYSVLTSKELIHSGEDIALLAMFMVITYFISLYVVHGRYK